ncbi:MAG TPA: serine hydrolase domain-containing protein [Bacteroidota bacterium]|nr:serine hydrolase domain-containing protein [Bacteroidota bacterium]
MNRRTIMLSAVLAGFLILQSIVSARQAGELAATPEGRIVQSYIAAFNAQDELQMKRFLETNLAPEALKERSVDQRMERFRMMKSDIRSITLTGLFASRPGEVAVKARNGSGGAITLTFGFTPDPVKMTTLRIELGDQPPAQGGPPIPAGAILDSMKQAIESRVSADQFSGAVLIAQDSTLLYTHAWGSADKRFSTPNTVETKFNLGSINKLFTRLAVGQLAEAGKLSFDDHFIRYLPDYPDPEIARKVTIRQLLTMTSGMGDFFGDEFAAAPKNRIRSLADYLPFFVHKPLEFEPGTSQRYSNAGYIVLGLIIEKISGENYYDYVNSHIVRPAGMTGTGYFEMDGVTPNLATGYQHPGGSGSGWECNIYTAPARGSSAGGGYSTVGDMLRFLRAIRSGRLLTPRYSEWIFTGALPHSDPSLPVRTGSLGIAGGAPGINAAVEYDADRDRAIIVLSNYSPPAAVDLAALLRAYMNRIR